MINNIAPCLWFDSEAEDAAKFYTSVFTNSSIGATTKYTKAGHEIHGQPEGKVMTVEFTLEGLNFVALNGGPLFKFNPSISFLVACATKEEVDALWQKLHEGGMALMELGAYPFSERYGWTTDRYGLSWQVMYASGSEIKQKITPTLMFVGDVVGRAEEAMQFYTSIFPNSALGDIMRYEAGEGSDKPGTVKHGTFVLNRQQFAAMDSAYEHKFAFNEAISLLVRVDTQEEIDKYWEKLSEGGDPKAQQCGWLKDKFGVSWQVSPIALDKMMLAADTEKVERVTNAFMPMKKIDLAELTRVFEGK